MAKTKNNVADTDLVLRSANDDQTGKQVVSNVNVTIDLRKLRTKAI